MSVKKHMEAAVPDDFVQSEGPFFVAHLLRRISDEIVQGCEAWYAQLGLSAPPRTASTLHLLYRRGPQCVTDIASILRQSHPLVVQWIRQLSELHMVSSAKDDQDRRRTVVSLTAAGRKQVELMLSSRPVFEAAYASLIGEADADVYEALWRLEQQLRRESFATRLANTQLAPAAASAKPRRSRKARQR